MEMPHGAAARVMGAAAAAAAVPPVTYKNQAAHFQQVRRGVPQRAQRALSQELRVKDLGHDGVGAARQVGVPCAREQC